MCRLMPFWSSVFRDADWSLRALLPLRSPLEVAWSLHSRTGIAPSYGCLLWLRHVLEAEAETREMPRAVLSWQDFLDDPSRALARVGECLDLAWPNWCERVLADIDAYVSADLRHHRASTAQMRAHPAINDLVRETYAAMLELVPTQKIVVSRKGWTTCARVSGRGQSFSTKSFVGCKRNSAASGHMAPPSVLNLRPRMRSRGRSARPLGQALALCDHIDKSWPEIGDERMARGALDARNGRDCMSRPAKAVFTPVETACRRSGTPAGPRARLIGKADA